MLNTQIHGYMTVINCVLLTNVLNFKLNCFKTKKKLDITFHGYQIL